MNSVRVTLYNRQRDLAIDPASVRALVRAFVRIESLQVSEIIVHFVTEERICQIHEDFFGDPSPTDCITFPIDDQILGEIFICPKAALDYCKKRGQKEIYRELSLYLVHALLHLIGFDDKEISARRAMRRKEKELLSELASSNKLLKN